MTDCSNEILIQDILAPEPRSESNGPDDSQWIIVKGSERLERSSDTFWLAWYKAEIGQAFTCLVFDLPGTQIVEEGVDGQVTTLGVFQRCSECLHAQAVSVHKLDTLFQCGSPNSRQSGFDFRVSRLLGLVAAPSRLTNYKPSLSLFRDA